VDSGFWQILVTRLVTNKIPLISFY
jgi:hypothetical protein